MGNSLGLSKHISLYALFFSLHFFFPFFLQHAGIDISVTVIVSTGPAAPAHDLSSLNIIGVSEEWIPAAIGGAVTVFVVFLFFLIFICRKCRRGTNCRCSRFRMCFRGIRCKPCCCCPNQEIEIFSLQNPVYDMKLE